MTAAEKVKDWKERLMVMKMLEAAQADDSTLFPRSAVISALERLIARYEQLDKTPR